MADKEYHIAHNYGYGLLGHVGLGGYGFAENAKVTIGGYNTLGFEEREITPEPAFRLITLSNVKQPLYLVREGKKWYEFFSHSIVVVNYDMGCKRYWENPVIDNESLLYRLTGTRAPVRKFIVILPSDQHSITIKTPREFEDAIKKYTNEEIQSMVNQFQQLVQNAPVWGKNFDELIEEIERRIWNKDENASSVLDNISGSFVADNHMCQNPTDISAPTEQQNSKIQQAEWICMGKCSYCGGEFKGLFRKKCEDCGEMKNY